MSGNEPRFVLSMTNLATLAQYAQTTKLYPDIAVREWLALFSVSPIHVCPAPEAAAPPRGAYDAAIQAVDALAEQANNAIRLRGVLMSCRNHLALSKGERGAGLLLYEIDAALSVLAATPAASGDAEDGQ